MIAKDDRAVDQCQQRSHLSYTSRWGIVMVLVMAACSPVNVQGQITFPSTPSFVIVPSPVATPTTPVAPQPVASPVIRPVATPVVQPNPVPAPVAPQPIAAPVKPPVTPTPRPTIPRTKAPTSSPTPWPSRSPSEAPTNIATASPTVSPTSRPSDAPSYVPTRLPTVLATTATPTLQPSLESPEPSTINITITQSPTLPEVVPTNQPTVEPTDIPPSGRPTLRPSSLPLSSESVNVVMSLVATNGVLRGRAAIDFEVATAAHIQLVTENSGYKIANLSLETTINTQEVVLAKGARRKLQNWQPLQIGLSILIEYQDSEQNDPFDPEVLVEEAFNSDEERELYINRLKEKNTEFSNLESVSLLVEGEVPEEETLGPEEGNNLGIIIGAIVGGVLGLALAAYFFSRRSRQEEGPVNKQVYSETALSTTDAPTRIQTEILVDRQDDVSTLGDPVFTGVMAMDIVDRDERTASVADDYDYAKEYLMGQARERMLSVDSGPSGKTTGTFGRVFADDASFEEQYENDEPPEDMTFEVHVPPGKLGMVIDTPNGGVPIVHAIKPESVLADKVLVGDRLVSVDGEDVTSMTAVQVSKLISVKSNEDRALKFVRNPNVIDSLGR